MEVHRLGVKFFATDASSVPAAEFIPIFHRWIQKQALAGHLLVDVHNYSHIHQGPGILLVAHEGNFSMDMGDERLGLFYYRKQPTKGMAEDHLTAILKTALEACVLLENEVDLTGRLQFRTDEFVIVANDRLNAPNDDDTLSQLKPPISAVLQRLLGGTNFTLSRISQDPADRFTTLVQTGQSSAAKTLLARL